MNADAQAVLAAFKKLDEDTKRQLLAELRRDTGPDPNPSIDALSRDLRENRFAKGLACPHCGSVAVRRFGRYRPAGAGGKARQRYQCKDCGKTFGDLTFSPMSRTHYPEKWAPFFEYMVQGLSLRKIAKLLDIHVSTAFYWRHRILTGLRRIAPPALDGIIEADETYMLESLKGKNQVKKLGTRKARKRGGCATKRGISREQVCVLVVVDRNKNVVSQTAGYGRISHKEVDTVVAPYMGEVTCLCTDSASCFKTFSRKKGIDHEVLNIKQGVRVKKGIFHIQNVNSYHSRFKDWVLRFKGVATKYLDNYLFWHRFIDLNRRMSGHQMKLAFMQDAYKQPVEVKDIYFRPSLLAQALATC